MGGYTHMGDTLDTMHIHYAGRDRGNIDIGYLPWGFFTPNLGVEPSMVAWIQRRALISIALLDNQLCRSVLLQL